MLSLIIPYAFKLNHRCLTKELSWLLLNLATSSESHIINDLINNGILPALVCLLNSTYEET